MNISYKSRHSKFYFLSQDGFFLDFITYKNRIFEHIKSSIGDKMVPSITLNSPLKSKTTDLRKNFETITRL